MICDSGSGSGFINDAESVETCDSTCLFRCLTLLVGVVEAYVQRAE
jgi:hypothetical protein